MPLSNTPSWPGPVQLTAEQADALNTIVSRHVRSRCLSMGIPRRSSPGFTHPWMTTAQRLTNQKWKIRVAPGCCNDELALYIYLAKGDPRGWKMPAGYVAHYSQPGTPNIVFRSPFDSDSQWNPPFLQVTAPDRTGKNLGDFIDITNARPSYFTGSEFFGVSKLGRLGLARNQPGIDISTWPLYQASVVLSASPYPGANTDLSKYVKSLTTQIKKFTLFAGHLPGPADNVDGGSFTEIARLYLLRNPSSPVLGDELFVQQKRFFCLQALAVQPSFGLGALADNTDYGAMIGAALSPIDGGLTSMGLGLIGAIGAQALNDAQQSLDQAQSVEFFSC